MFTRLANKLFGQVKEIASAFNQSDFILICKGSWRSGKQHQVNISTTSTLYILRDDGQCHQSFLSDLSDLSLAFEAFAACLSALTRCFCAFASARTSFLDSLAAALASLSRRFAAFALALVSFLLSLASDIVA